MTPSRTCILTLALFVAAFAGPTHAQTGDTDMILIPAGPFTRGSPGKTYEEDAAEKPVQQVDLPAFSMDKYEVTCAQYCVFLNAAKRVKDDAGHEYIGLTEYLPLEQVNGEWKPKAGKETHPMANVTWFGATAYAKWAGKRLPTEAEWEKAARGTDGRRFPWGETWDGSRCIYGFDNIKPGGSFPAGASPYGGMDMAGNVWEWTSSIFRPYPYVATDGREDPNNTEERRVARGGSWNGEPFIAHSAYRFRPCPTFRHMYIGFRCAK